MSFPLIILLSILISMFESALSTVYCMLVFEPKNKTAAFFGCFFPRLFTVIFKYIYISEMFSMFMYGFGLVGTVLIIYFFYDRNLSRGLMKTFIGEMIVGVGIALESLFVHDVLKTNVVQPHLFYPDMLDVDLTPVLLEKIFLVVLYIGVGLALGHIFRKVSLPQKVCSVGAVVCMTYFCIEFYAGMYYVYTPNARMTQFDFFFLMAMTVIVSLVTKILFDNHTKKMVMLENANLQRLNNIQYERFAAVEQYNDEIRRMRHDITNHLHTMQVLLADGEQDECKKYTDSLISQFSSNRVCFCENRIIDAVVFNASGKAEEKGIGFEAQISVPNDIGMKQTDIVSIFANLLDNASEAAERTEDGFVRINASVKDDSLMIKCDNSFGGDVSVRKDGTLVTSKIDSVNHGMGTRIIKSAVDNYSGSILYDSKDNVFSCVIMIPLETVDG